MNRLMITACAAWGCALAACAAPEWEDLAINSRNRLPARSYTMPLASEKAALGDALEPNTPYRQSLNGIWKISWAGNPDLRVKDFYRVDFDDSRWFTIDVPSCVEMRGFGSPGYTNVNYPHAWDPKKDLKNPTIRDRQTDARDYNPVSSYRRSFTVPENWRGRDIILRFDGVYSAYYVWVNGQKVGYAEDSKLPSEFNITPFVKEGKNVLAVEVYRWSDGSFLEDQDMFRFSGIFRDVTLWAQPKNGIWDFTVKTEVASDYASAKLRVTGCDGAEARLYDATKKLVGSFVCGKDAFTVEKVNLWSAEKPYLYTLVLKQGDDYRMKRVGFKEQKIVGNLFLVNGKPVKFKGVNRHETSPENGRAITQDDMIADITLFKRYNINTVRTSHYPNHHLWYDLCDRYGIYVIAEANVEGHEPRYGETGLGREPAYDHAIVERNERHVVFYRNHASVTMWSLGNETGHGDCFRHAVAAVKGLDATRPVHWERGNRDADIDSRMYPPVEWLEERGKLGDSQVGTVSSYYSGNPDDHTKGKCHILCEYAHAMGNAVGNLQEYWDVIYAHPSLTGGCIWDWIDQAVWKTANRIDPLTGKPDRFLAYGGDFDEQPNDGPFCCNGVIGPLRDVTAKLIEVGHVYRNLVVTRTKGASVFTLENRNLFTAADEFDGTWALVVNGETVRTGTFAPPCVAPLAKGEFALPELDAALQKVNPDAECFVNVSFLTKAATAWAAKGWTVARNQVSVKGAWDYARAAQVVASAVQFTEDAKSVTVLAGPTRAVFCRRSGTLCELTMHGKTILHDPAPGVVSGPRFTCMRALTDNDNWIRRAGANVTKEQSGRSCYSRGLTQLRYHARPFVIRDNALYVETEITGSKSAGFIHEAVWSFAADGAVSVKNTVTPHGTMPQVLPRAGLSLVLDPSLDNVSYYGRGPRENYRDRLTGSFLGVWSSTVAELAEFYVRPQDNGYRSDVRWVRFVDKAGLGVACAASQPLYVQALHNDWEDLEFARHRNGQERMRAPVPVRPEIYLNLDVAQTGLGGNSCGPIPMEKYCFHPTTLTWTQTFRPIR